MSDNLVAIPWQPEYFLTPDTLALLVAAGDRLATQLRVTDAWRSYAQQAYYYDQFLHHGGPPASSPEPPGQRNHMRGAAFDLQRTDSRAQDACRAVGLRRDAIEAWHWNNPNWANMPIIPTHTIASGVNPRPIPIPPMETTDMGKFLRAPDTSMGYIGPDGMLIPLKDMDEVRSYEYIGLAKQSETQSVSSLVWQKLSAAAGRQNTAK
jgi:hypothetical protein